MILSDEAYYDLVFDPKSKFYSFGNLSKEVPVIVTSSVSKLFCVPGWRLGWMIVYNNKNYFDEFLKSVTTTTQLFLSAPTLVQAALPEMLLNTPPEFHENYKRKVKVFI
jgi:tyrosine aminotransferase